MKWLADVAYPAFALCWAAEGGAVLADLGYRGDGLTASLWEEAEALRLTPADGGARRSAQRALLSSVREGVETLSQLWGRFVERVFSRSWAGLCTTIKLKLLHHNLVHAGVLSV